MKFVELNKAQNIVKYTGLITRHDREILHGHRGCIVWFTGLPSSGKSTLAHAVESYLYHKGYKTFVLDGDNVRYGLCSDLGFSKEDRTENLRRIAEISKLLIEGGLVVLAAFVSPLKSDRDKVRTIVGAHDYIEVFCSCPIETCEQRDPKQHYQKARSVQIKEFTGISSPYEIPESPDLVVDTSIQTIASCVESVSKLLKNETLA